MEFLFLLLGLAALLAVTDLFSNTDKEPEEEAPPEEDEPTIVTGTDGDDLLVGNGGAIIFGLEGDDTLLSTGDDTLVGGPGNDVLISDMGTPYMVAEDGENRFIIILGQIEDQVDDWPVIADFLPSADTLVIDLEDLGLSPDEQPVVLSADASEFGAGLLILVNGVTAVELEGFGTGDPQTTLEALFFEFGVLEVIGAAWAFPESLPAGIASETDPETGAITFFVTDDFSLGPAAIDAGDLPGTLDLTQTARELTISVDDDGTLLIRDPLIDTEILRATSIERLILGAGLKAFDASGTGFAIAVESIGGQNVIIGGDGNDSFTVSGPLSFAFGGGGDNTLIGSDGATLRGGSGTDMFRVEVSLGGPGTPAQDPVIIEEFAPGSDVLTISITYPADQDPPDVTTQISTDPDEVYFLLGERPLAILSGMAEVPGWSLSTEPI